MWFLLHDVNAILKQSNSDNPTESLTEVFIEAETDQHTTNNTTNTKSCLT